MKKTLNIMIVAFTLFGFSCGKDPQKASVIDTYLIVCYKDNQGRNLLDPSTPNYFINNNIRLYKIERGIKTLDYNAMADSPFDFTIYKDSLSGSVINIGIEADTTLIQLNDDITDTIVSQIRKLYSGTTLITDKVWYNRSLIWERESQKDRYFTIIKNP
jgi:hypothetical protein